MIDTLINFVTALTWVYTLLILLWVVMSWLQLPYNRWIYGLRGFLSDTVEPYIRVFRSILPAVGPFDFSPIVAIVVLQAAQLVAVAILEGFR
jgi:YggT family protein